jgi:hypothetical protein
LKTAKKATSWQKLIKIHPFRVPIKVPWIWPSNHTFHTKVYFNEFVANALHDNLGEKKISLHPQKNE